MRKNKSQNGKGEKKIGKEGRKNVQHERIEKIK